MRRKRYHVTDADTTEKKGTAKRITMSDRGRKDHSARIFRFPSAAGIAEVMAYVLAVTLSVMCVVIAFYAQDGYNQIGNAKFVVYKVTILAGFFLFLALGAVYGCLFLREKGKWKIRLSVTDGCVLAYLLFSTISVVSGGFYEDALWGSYGWNMDVAAQLCAYLSGIIPVRKILSRSFGSFLRIGVLCICDCGIAPYAD